MKFNSPIDAIAPQATIVNHRPVKRSRATLPVLLMAAGLGVMQGASGCGRADSSRVDSETHWLMSCDTDLDCGAGSCECGVCTTACASSADCSALGVSGVECVAPSGLCGASGESVAGTSAAAASACFLPCEGDADCSALGAGAVCESQRCERPASVLAGGAGATGSTAPAVLCDGSEDVRFLWVGSGSDGLENNYFFFAEARGAGFLAIDGQCRFWQAGGATDPVTSGTLSAEDAAAFATAIGYERFAEYAPYNDQEGCLGVGLTRIWSPDSRAHCLCACSEDPELEGWGQVINAMLEPGVKALFASGQTLAGPLRLALIRYPRIVDVPVAWPLSRAPAENETYELVDSDPPRLDESSGVEITDPGERSALRAARDAYIARDASRGFTPLVWTDPDTQQPTWFHMLLRDEVPANVQAALERPSF
jgi:hypothetical protein